MKKLSNIHPLKLKRLKHITNELKLKWINEEEKVLFKYQMKYIENTWRKRKQNGRNNQMVKRRKKHQILEDIRGELFQNKNLHLMSQIHYQLIK